MVNSLPQREETASWAARRQGRDSDSAKPGPSLKAVNSAFLGKKLKSGERNAFFSLVSEKISTAFLISKKILRLDSPVLRAPEALLPLA